MIKKQSIIILIFLMLIMTACTNGPKAVDSYMIAFVEEGTGIVRIRYAGEDPNGQWADGQSGDGGRIPGDNHLAAGLGSHHAGGTAVLGTLVGNTIELRVGIGALFSDDPDDTIPNARSSPSFAHIDGSEYMIAYQNFDPNANVQIGWLEVRPWDPSPGSDVWDGAGQMFVIGENQFPNNDYLVARPAIAYLKEEQLLLVVWYRSGATVANPNAPPPRTVQYALGTYPYTDGLNTIVNWTEYGEFPILPDGYLPFYGTPSLATDGESFYLGIARQEFRTGGDGLYNPELFIYKSSDGRSWTEIAVRSCPVPYVYTNIAVQPDGEMLVGMISSGDQWFYLVRNGNWTELDAQRVLGRRGVPYEFEIVTRTFLVNEEQVEDAVHTTRYIPLRWIELHAPRHSECQLPGGSAFSGPLPTTGGNAWTSSEWLNWMIAEMNKVFEGSDIQFWLQSHDVFCTETVAWWDDTWDTVPDERLHTYEWDAVKADIEMVFPHAGERYDFDGEMLHRRAWLHKGFILYGDPHGLTFFVHSDFETAVRDHHQRLPYEVLPQHGYYPWYTPGVVYMFLSAIVPQHGHWEFDEELTPAHEIGHALGNCHTHDFDGFCLDAGTFPGGEPYTWADHWDLITAYTGSGHLGFSSRAEAEKWLADFPALQPVRIDRFGEVPANITLDAGSGRMTATVSGTNTLHTYYSESFHPAISIRGSAI